MKLHAACHGLPHFELRSVSQRLDNRYKASATMANRLAVRKRLLVTAVRGQAWPTSCCKVLIAPRMIQSRWCRPFTSQSNNSKTLANATIGEVPLGGNIKGHGMMTTHELDRTRNGRQRVVILGSGWAGYPLSRNLDQSKFQVVIVSPRSYFVFTPFLASTSVGTLEFRTALEPIRRRKKTVDYIQGRADDVSFHDKTITIEEAVRHRSTMLACACSLLEID